MIEMQSIYRHCDPTCEDTAHSDENVDGGDEFGWGQQFAPPDVYSYSLRQRQPTGSTTHQRNGKAYLRRGGGAILKDSSASIAPARSRTDAGRGDVRRLKVKTKPPVPRFNARLTPQSTRSDDQERDFLKENQASLWKHAVRNRQHVAEVSRTKRGEIPAYLKNIKAKRAKDAQRAAAEAQARHAEARRGSSDGAVMDNKERIALLAQVKARRKAVEVEFQRFSHNATHGPKRRAYIESLAQDMDELDAMITKLNNPVVVIGARVPGQTEAGGSHRRHAW